MMLMVQSRLVSGFYREDISLIESISIVEQVEISHRSRIFEGSYLCRKCRVMRVTHKREPVFQEIGWYRGIFVPVRKILTGIFHDIGRFFDRKFNMNGGNL